MTRTDTATTLANLYERDETAWLEQSAAIIADGRLDLLDLPHLSEYLFDMAKRDKREVLHRLIVLLVHLLKWDFQPDMRSRSWELTIQEQRDELQDLLESATLRTQAELDFGRAYEKAVRRAAVETGLEETAFAVECPFTFEQVIGA